MSVCARTGFVGSITETVRERERGSAPMDSQEEMAYGESIGHVIDDVA